MGSRSPFALFSPLLYKATREANPLPALAPATSLPRGPGSLWWKGGQWIRRPAVYSCSLGLGFVARSSGVRRHAPARLTAPSNKVPSRSASNAASLAVVGHGSGSVVAGFGRQDDGGDQTLVFCASVLSSSRRRSLRLRPQISKLVQERGGRHGLHQCRHSGDLLLRCKVCGSWRRFRCLPRQDRRQAPDLKPTKHGECPGRRTPTSAPRRSRRGPFRLTKPDQAMVLFRPLGRWRPTSFSGVFRRRRLAVGMASDAERLTTGTYLLFFVFLGLSAFVPGHLYLLDFARGCCVCIESVFVIW